MTLYATPTDGTDHHQSVPEGALQPGGWTLLRDRYARPDQRDRLVDRYLHPVEVDGYQSRLDGRAQAWLLGRVAAKDAVGQRLAEAGYAVAARDFAVVDDADGRSRVLGLHHLAPELHVSVAHVDGCAVAITGQGATVGIAIEPVEDRPSSFNRLAFTKAERAGRHLAGVDDRTWMTAAWTAKYAVARALGTGLDGDATQFETRVAGPGLLAVADRVVRWVQLDSATATSRDGRSLIVGWTVVPESIIDLDRPVGASTRVPRASM